MTIYEKVATAIALCALVASVWAVIAVRKHATSDFVAAQRVKTESLQLVATLVSIVNKAATYRARSLPVLGGTEDIEPVDLGPEIRSIADFLNSPTSMAYLIHSTKKSLEASKEEEPWRVFHLQLSRIVTARDPRVAAGIAAEILALLKEMTESDFEEVSRSIDNLPRVLGGLKTVLEEDQIISASIKIWSQQEYSSNVKAKALIDALREAPN